MEPLAAAPREQLRNVEIVVFDVDDTLTRAGRLEAESAEAMRALSEAGLKLVAVTGRPLGYCDMYAAGWPLSIAVGENGAGWVWHDGAGLRRDYFHHDAERHRQRTRLEQIAQEVWARHPDVHLAFDQGARRCDLAFDVGERDRLPPPVIAALVDTMEREGARTMVSTVHAHAVLGVWDKAKGAVRAVRAVLGTDLEAHPERALFVGDSGNDAAAFAFFPLSVGVSNVRAHLDRLPVYPRYVTETDRGRGFLEMAHALLEARVDGAPGPG